MNINLSYEAFIRSFQLFYIGKLQMSDTNAKTTNRRIQYNEFISVTDNAIKKLKQKAFSYYCDKKNIFSKISIS